MLPVPIKKTRLEACGVSRFLGSLIFFLSGAIGAQQSVVAVLYPEVERPFADAYTQILDGIDAHRQGVAIRPYQLRADTAETLRPWLRSVDPTAVITLGRRARDAYAATALTVPSVVGGIEGPPAVGTNTTGVSLATDPDTSFHILKSVNPAIKRVLTVQNTERQKWLIERAQKSAKAHDLELHTYDATNLSEASRHFWGIFRYANPKTDALWLATDVTIVDEAVNLPMIVEQSWYRDMTVFSNNLAHARQGVLFAVYPDLRALGEQLIGVAQRTIVDPKRLPEFELSAVAHSALNARVASHLNIRMKPDVRRLFAIVFEGQ